VRFAWIDEHRKSLKDEYEVGLAPLCRMLDASRQGCFAWKKRKPGKRQKRKVEVVKQIQQAYADGRKTCGSPRVHRALKANNVNINEKTVAKYMKETGLRPRMPIRPSRSARRPPTAATSIPSPTTSSTGSSSRRRRTKATWRTSPTFPPPPASCTWRW
jgi:hypothetical protein